MKVDNELVANELIKKYLGKKPNYKLINYAFDNTALGFTISLWRDPKNIQPTIAQLQTCWNASYKEILMNCAKVRLKDDAYYNMMQKLWTDYQKTTDYINYLNYVNGLSDDELNKFIKKEI